MHIKKLLGYFILSQILCFIFFLRTPSDFFKIGTLYVWLICEGITIITVIILWLTKKAIDWIYE